MEFQGTLKYEDYIIFEPIPNVSLTFQVDDMLDSFDFVQQKERSVRSRNDIGTSY